MSTTEAREWRHTSPLAVIFYLGKIFQVIAQNAVQTFAPLIALSFAYEGDLQTKLVFGAIAFVTITITASILRYLFFRYKITDDSVLIREGVINKTQLDIKFDRIQAINTQQNIIYRFFNLITVSFDTAGSKGQEGNLPAIKPELADALREKIRRKKRVQHDSADEAEQPVITGHPPILSLTNADMIRIGLSDNRALLFLAFLGPLFEQIDGVIESMIDENTILAALALKIGVAQGFSLGVLFVVGFLLLLALASVVGAFLRFHRFKLTESNEVFQSTGGLLTSHAHSINRAKIQTLVTTQNIILRFFGRYRLSARQASPGKGHSKKDFAVPVCLPADLESLSPAFFAGELPGIDTNPKSQAFHRIAFQYVRSRTAVTALLPAILVSVVFSFAMGWYSLLFLLWVPLYGLANWQLYRRYGVQVNQHGLALRRGFLGYRVTTFLHRKVQRIGLTQTFFQRRKGLATLRFYLASGTIKVPYIDYAKALKLRDYVLYRVESSQMAWH